MTRPEVTGQDVKDAIDQSQNETREFTDSLIDFSRENVTEPFKEYAKGDEDTILEDAQKEAIDKGYFPGTTAFEEQVNNYVNEQEKITESKTSNGLRPEEVYAQPRRTRDLAENLMEQFGYSPERAMQMAENPEAWNFDTGRPKMQGNGTPKMSWEDAIGRDRFMDDLMLMNAPGFDSNGNPNTAAQALFSDNISTEDKLHLFDKGGNFFNPNSGVNISEAFANLVANDPAHASGTKDPNLKQMIYTTEEEFAKMFSDFLDANPLIASMYDAGILTLDDIKNNFFKEVSFGSGSGNPKPYYGGGYGYSGGGGGGYGYPYGGGSKSSKANTWINQSQATVKKQQERQSPVFPSCI